MIEATPELRRAIAEDLRFLASLHDRELDAGLWAILRQAPVQERLALELDDEEGRAALSLMDNALTAGSGDPVAMDFLAAEFASIYLTNAYRASPDESVWIDPEGLERQEPMFDVRRWYEHYGLKAENWRMRSDDHLVLQLFFIAHLIALTEHPAALNDAARFMDRHLLRWVRHFAATVHHRTNSEFYAGLALTTAIYVRRLRKALVVFANEPLVEPEPIEAEKQRHLREAYEDSCAYVPGMSESW